VNKTTIGHNDEYVFTSYDNFYDQNGDPVVTLWFSRNGRIAASKQMSLANHMLWRFKRVAIIMGANPLEFEGSIDTDVVLEQLVGKTVRLKGIDAPQQYDKES